MSHTLISTFLILGMALGTDVGRADTQVVTTAAGSHSVYGVPWNADGLSNVQVGGQQNRGVGIRFRAKRDGILDRIKVFFIFSTWQDVAAQGSDKCQVDHLGCYGAGDGGDVRIKLQMDDGSGQHSPSGKVLSSRLIRKPMNRNRKAPVYAWGSGLRGRPTANFWEINMPNARLRAGRIYHLVFSNPSPNPRGNFVSLDHLYLAANAPGMQPAVPDRDLASESVQWQQSRWRVRYWETPIYEVQYTGGFVQGQGYSGTSVNYPNLIYGSNRARQTVGPAARRASAVFIRLKKQGTPGPLTVRLETSNGALVEEGIVQESSVSTTDTWVQYVFAAPRSLSHGLNVVLSATGDSENHYRIFTLIDGGWVGFTASNLFTHGRAQINRGSGWLRPFSGYGTDFQIYFGVVAR